MIKKYIKLLKKGDLLLMGLLFIAGIGGLFFTRFLTERGNSLTIMAGQSHYTFSLNQDRDVILKGPIGYTLLKIQNGQAWIVEAPCSYQICKRMGKISRTGQTLVCVPNRIFITVEGKKALDIDAVSG